MNTIYSLTISVPTEKGKPMREILFRGKRLGDGEWVDGSLFIDEKKDKHEILVGYVNYRVGWEVDPNTVGQFTGLTDKNDKKIFEGDILKADGLAYACFWDFGNLEFGLEDQTESFGLCYYAQHDLEIIGNIHDNPELLGGDGDV